MTTQQHQLHAIIYGRVQGVNFRYTTMQTARQLGLVGWVRNRKDRTVEVVAEGTKNKLEQLLKYLHNGPPAAEVDRVTSQWLEPENTFTTFEIRYFALDI